MCSLWQKKTFKSWCQSSRQLAFTRGNALNLQFYVQNSQKKVESMYAQSDCSFHLNSKHKSSQRKSSTELGCSSYLFEYGKQNHSDQLDCLVEKISQPDEESSIIMEGAGGQ